MARKKKENTSEELLSFAAEVINERHGIAKTSALLEGGVPYKSILSMVENGELVRVKSGYYSLPDASYSEEETVVAQYPDGVLTMETALYYQGYLPERPAVWSIAISKNVSKSRFKMKFPVVQPYFTEEAVLSLGVEEIKISDQMMQIYTVDRLICDVFKYRDRMEKEDFRSSIESYIRDDEKDLYLLMEYAAKRRVLNQVKTVLGAWLNLPDGAPKEQTKPVEKKKEKSAKTPRIWVDNSEKKVRIRENISSEETSLPKEETDNVDTNSIETDAENLETLEKPTAGEVAEKVFKVLQRMELLDDMGVLVWLYRVLCEYSIDGIAVSRRLIEYCEEEDFPLDRTRIRKMHTWGMDRFMEQKWSRYVKRQGNLSLSWNDVIEKLSAFVVPIGISMIERRHFTGDWMPKLGRFLE